MYKSVLFTLAAALTIASCDSQPAKQVVNGSSATKSPAGGIPVLVEADQFELEMKANNAQLVDVRTPGEWNTGHLPGAMLADISDFDAFRQIASELDNSRPVLVYCAVGGRSKQAAAWLSDNGYNMVYDLKGGINAWRSAGKTIVKDN